MHNYSDLEEEITNLVWFFEGVEKLRESCDRKITQLAKRRQCQCGYYYYPWKARTQCPQCGGKLRSKEKVMTCEKCGYIASELGCPRCHDRENWKAAPKDHTYIKESILPGLRSLEDNAEKALVELVRQHPVWEWGYQVKGLGPTTVGRMVSACDIERCTTLSKFFAHFGWGLRIDGTPQRKVRGEKLNYDTRAQSIAYMMASNLESQRDKYYGFYQDWKSENLAKGFGEGQATSRAFRNMLQLALSHFYEVWRTGVGLSYSEPYPYTILRPPHDIENKITPSQMVVLFQEKGQASRSPRSYKVSPLVAGSKRKKASRKSSGR